MDREDPTLHCCSKQHYFMSINFKIIGGGGVTPPSVVVLPKMAHVDEGYLLKASMHIFREYIVIPYFKVNIPHGKN